MQKSLLLFFLLPFFLGSCSSETSDEFTQRIFSLVKDGNRSGLSKEFVTSKADITTMLLATTQPPNKKLLDKMVNKMYQARSQDKRDLLKMFQRNGLGDWKNVKYIGSSHEFKKENTKVGTIRMAISNGEKMYDIMLESIKLKSGKWKLTDYPRVWPKKFK